MSRGLRYSEQAISDLGSIRRWLTQPGAGPVARRRLMSIRLSIDRLRIHPCAFPIGSQPGVRELLCEGGYQAMYRVRPDTGKNDTAGDVTILRVFGPGQDRRLAGARQGLN